MRWWIVLVVLVALGVVVTAALARAMAPTDEEREAEDRIQRFGR